MSNNLYKKVVEISEEFLGPAGERFVRRQVETHFKIEPEKLEPKHLPELVDWTRLTFSMITEDTSLVNDFTNRLLHLSHTNTTHKTNMSNSYKA